MRACTIRGFWASSFEDVVRRVVCDGEVPGRVFDVEVADVFLRVCLGVFGLLGTEATSDGGRGTKPGSRSGLILDKVSLGSGGGRI